MKTRQSFARVLGSIAMLCMLAPQVVGATSTVRGKLIRIGPQGTYPAGGIRVTVNSQYRGRSNPAYSGPDGMFYLYNIPPGQYVLEVWATSPALFFTIQVREQPFSDVAPIRVP